LGETSGINSANNSGLPYFLIAFFFKTIAYT